jgi:hypothetical protein
MLAHQITPGAHVTNMVPLRYGLSVGTRMQERTINPQTPGVIQRVEGDTVTTQFEGHAHPFRSDCAVIADDCVSAEARSAPPAG